MGFDSGNRSHVIDVTSWNLDVFENLLAKLAVNQTCCQRIMSLEFTPDQFAKHNRVVDQNNFFVSFNETLLSMRHRNYRWCDN